MEEAPERDGDGDGDVLVEEADNGGAAAGGCDVSGVRVWGEMGVKRTMR